MCQPDFDAFGIVFKGRARQHALSLVADIEKDLVGGEGDDRALQLLCAACGLVRVAALKLGKQRGKVFRRLCDGFGSVFGGGLGFRNGFVGHGVYCSILP